MTSTMGNGDATTTIRWRRHRPTIRVVSYASAKTRYYARGIRLPRWLFVLLFGDPRIVVNGHTLDGPRDEVRR